MTTVKLSEVVPTNRLLLVRLCIDGVIDGPDGPYRPGMWVAECVRSSNKIAQPGQKLLLSPSVSAMFSPEGSEQYAVISEFYVRGVFGS